MKLRSIIVSIAVAIGMLLGMSFAGADVMTDTLAELKQNRVNAIQKLREVEEQSAYIQRYISELNGGIATIVSLKESQDEIDKEVEEGEE